MTTSESSGGGSRGLLRGAARIALAIGAAGSLALMFRVGRNNPSVVLMGLFTIWALSPFVALLAVDAIWKRRPAPVRATLYVLMLIIAVGSLAVYAAVALGPPRPKPAFFFLAVPFASWLLIAAAAFASGRRHGA